ncbi:MAG: DctP family TRAP transporter solute-binding subunit [Enterocloster citroniae]|jgi:tripartite ATP-independent transporter DctP family solute receptor|nr:DctP family TRAP transporter solute-binding subunit [Enterocloster citroniae]
MKKKVMAAFLGVVMVLSVSACGGTNPSGTPAGTPGAPAGTEGTLSGTAAGGGQDAGSDTLMGDSSASVRFKVGTTTAPEGHYVKGLIDMQKRLEEYGSGEMTLDIYPNSQLGNERDMMENVGMGVQEMCLISTGPIPNFIPDFAVLDLPYLFDDEEHAYEVLDGEVGTLLLAQLETQGIHGVGFWENGFRQLTNNKKEIKTPADLKGMKIRTMENNVHMAAYKALGATATPMAWSEIFTALQQGTVDGQENPIAIIETAKVYEVQKYVSMIDLFYSPCVLMISQSSYDGLTDAQREAFDRAAEEARDYQREYSRNYGEEAIGRMEEAGVVITKVDKDLWKDAVSCVYDQADSLGLNRDLIEKLTSQISR